MDSEDMLNDVKQLRAALEKARKEETERNDSDIESLDSDTNEADDKIICEDSNDLSEIKNQDNNDKNLVITPPEDDVLDTTEANENLEKLLILNREKTKLLSKLKTALQSKLMNLKMCLKKSPRKGMKPSKYRIFKQRDRLGAPFFKDHDYYACPRNDDFKTMINNNESAKIVFFQKVYWTEADRINLMTGVYSFVSNIRLSEINKSLETSEDQEVLLEEKRLIEQDDILAENWPDNNLDNLKLTLDNLQSQFVEEASVSDSNIDSLIKTTTAKLSLMKYISEYERIDWLMISATYLNDRHNYTHCKAIWDCLLNPKLSHTNWTSETNERLKQAVLANNSQDWDSIAKSLALNKSAYQCCVQYHSKINNNSNKGKWTAEEDQYVRNVIESSRMGNIVRWGQISTQHTLRTKVQIYNRHKYYFKAATTKKGAFSVAEDILLLTLHQLKKPNGTLQIYFPNRTLSQLRSRFTMLEGDNSQPWTLTEDQAIIDHVEIYGEGNWNQVDINRSSACIRQRYFRLRDWFRANPNCSLEKVSRRSKRVLQQSEQNNQIVIKQAIETLLAHIKPNRNNFDILNVSYIQKVIAAMPNKPRTMRKRKKRQVVRKLSNIDTMILDLFKPSCSVLPIEERTNKADIHQDLLIEKSAKRINFIWELFEANLHLPTLQQIQTDPRLSNEDKLILTKIVELRQNQIEPAVKSYAIHITSTPSTAATFNLIETTPETEGNSSNSTVRQQKQNLVIPPCLETMNCFVNNLEYRVQLLEHARSIYRRKIFMFPKPDKPKGLPFYQKEINLYLQNLDPETNAKVQKERDLFFYRLYKIMKYPCLLSTLTNAPSIQNQASLQKYDKTILETFTFLSQPSKL